MEINVPFRIQDTFQGYDSRVCHVQSLYNLTQLFTWIIPYVCPKTLLHFHHSGFHSKESTLYIPQWLICKAFQVFIWLD